MYRHLNDSKDGYTVGIEEYAARLDKLNYGVHRMLSAIARNRLDEKPTDPIGNALRELLNSGGPSVA